jgi:phosphoenolpyruvate-protein kinase (PTS system EI component)
MPYFPGVARGRQQRGLAGDISQSIVMIHEQEFQAPVQLPAGLVVVESAPFSHRMIGLLGLGVPTVLITEEQATQLDGVAELMIDGDSGLITNDLQYGAVEEQTPVESAASMQMADGEAIHLLASVRQPQAAKQALDLGAESIGLVRSEFLQPEDGSLPDKAYYLEAFRAIAEAAEGLTVSVRLLDSAADKLPGWLPPTEGAGQALGMQGTRLYSTEPVNAVIDAQLAALKELADDFKLRVIVPYIVRLEEYEFWLARVREALPRNVPVGVMAETPASVLDIEHMITSADFVSIGCNDLMQSVFAADRDVAELRHYLDPYAPVLFRLFRQIAEQAAEGLDKVQLCGLLPQIQAVLPVLLGLGYRSFSVDAPFIPHLALVASRLSQAECEDLARRVCAARTTQEALEILQLPTDRHPPFLF